MRIKKGWQKVDNQLQDPEHWDAVRGIGPNAMQLYLYLVTWMDDEKRYIGRKYQTIYEDTGVPVRTLKEWMRKLKKNGYVEVTRFAQSMGIHVVPLGVRHKKRSASSDTSPDGREPERTETHEPVEGRQEVIEEVLNPAPLEVQEVAPHAVFLPKTEVPVEGERSARSEGEMGQMPDSEVQDVVTGAENSTSSSDGFKKEKQPTGATCGPSDKSLLKRFSVLDSLRERGDSLETEAELFWELASRVHNKIHHLPLLNKNIEKDLEKIKTFFSENVIDFNTLLIAYVSFCRSRDDYLRGRPRNIAMFFGQVDDHLVWAGHKRWAMSERLKERRQSILTTDGHG